MVHVFYDKRGSGKTKALINMANEKVLNSKGSMIYIDDDNRPLFELDRKIRFISTEQFGLMDANRFYGFLCGMISENYDIDNIFIDGLFNIVDGNEKDTAYFFCDLEKFAQKNNVEFYINVNSTEEKMPGYMEKYTENYICI